MNRRNFLASLTGLFGLSKMTSDATTFEFPPGSGNHYRPGPSFQARWLGVWPDISEGVWSEALWRACLVQRPLPAYPLLPRIGCDVARFGDDRTAFHLRWGSCSMHHESHNGWDTMRTAGRLIELTRVAVSMVRIEVGAVPVKEQDISIIVDQDGIGSGVCDRLREQGYLVRDVSAGSAALRPDLYPNLRSELWFAAAQRAREGMLDVTRLAASSRDALQHQLMAPTWKLDSQGRRVCEPKAETKKRIKRSPDDADAMNLAYHEGGWESVPNPEWTKAGARTAGRLEERYEDDSHESGAARRGMFGRGR